jgi:hypothetical protein
MSQPWSRREFLERALLQLGSLPLLGMLGCSGDADEPSVEISDALRAMLRARLGASAFGDYFGAGDPDALMQLGSSFLYAQLSERAPADAAIVMLLQPTIELLESADSEEHALDMLRSAIEREFAERGAVDLAGWALAPTELRLAALYFIVR